MQISKETLEVLHNFASINPNILIGPGQDLKTIAEAKNIMAQAHIPETFPVEFGIYDLNEFLAVIGLIQTPDLDFGGDKVIIKYDTSRVNYFYSEKTILTTPTKEITMPDPELSINITEDHINQIRKASAILGHSELVICGGSPANQHGPKGTVRAEVYDTNDATSNAFSLELDNANPCTNDFKFIFNIPNLKLLPGDYYVNISSKLISHWTSSTYPINYFIALEKASEYHV
jgi:hypothetical protein